MLYHKSAMTGESGTAEFMPQMPVSQSPVLGHAQQRNNPVQHAKRCAACSG